MSISATLAAALRKEERSLVAQIEGHPVVAPLYAALTEVRALLAGYVPSEAEAVEAAAETAPKKRRGRRSKAQIAADEAAKAKGQRLDAATNMEIAAQLGEPESLGNEPVPVIGDDFTIGVESDAPNSFGTLGEALHENVRRGRRHGAAAE